MMKENPDGGSIINIASILGMRVMSWSMEYTTSKATPMHHRDQFVISTNVGLVVGCRAAYDAWACTRLEQVQDSG